MDENVAVEPAGERPAPMTGAARSRASDLLREVVALVDGGEIEATAAERAHLAGAAEALDRLG